MVIDEKSGCLEKVNKKENFHNQQFKSLYRFLLNSKVQR